MSILRRRTFIVSRKLQYSILLTALGCVGVLVLVVRTEQHLRDTLGCVTWEGSPDDDCTSGMSHP